MSAKENIDCATNHTSTSTHSESIANSRKGGDENCNTEKGTMDSCDFKECSDVLEDILKEANIASPVDNEKLPKDDESSASDYSSGSEEYSDPMGHVPFAEDEPGIEKETADIDEDEEIEIDEEQLKEMQKDWSEDDVQVHKEGALSLKDEGNEHFRSARYSEAIESYTQALNTCPLQCSPERAVLYANRAAAKISLEQKEEAVLDCNKAIELNPSYLKALLRRAQLHRKLENLDQCLADYQKVLEMDPNSREAREACMVLPQEIAERNEKLKTEMLGKLKDLGNLVLRPFGLSTDNFNLVQDPNTGGYSVSFQNSQNGK